MTRILAVEDTHAQQILIRETLEDEEHAIVFAPTIADATRALKECQFDLVLLDVSLPDGDGFQFFASLRQSGQLKTIPVIFLTGKSDIAQKVMGFSLGAEDYITKPVHPLELKARVEARLRNSGNQKQQMDILRRGTLQINVSLQQAIVHDGSKELRLDLTPLEFKLLIYFARHVDHVFSRQQLMSAVHGDNVHVSDRTIDTHVSNIKRKLAACDYTIKSIYGVGYAFSKATPS